MITSVVLSILLAALGSINPMPHSEARASQDTTVVSRGINPVQHSE